MISNDTNFGISLCHLLKNNLEPDISLTHRPTVLNKRTTKLKIFEFWQIIITKRFIISCNLFAQCLGYDNHVLNSSNQTRFIRQRLPKKASRLRLHLMRKEFKTWSLWQKSTLNMLFCWRKGTWKAIDRARGRPHS